MRRQRRRSVAATAQVGDLRVAEAQRLAISGDAIGAPILRCREAHRRRQRDTLIEIVVTIEQVRVKTVHAIGHHADTADRRTVKVQRKSTRISGESKRRALRPHTRRTTLEPSSDIRARQLAELHAEQRAAGCQNFTWVEMRLHDLTRGASAERVALARQIRAGDGLGDRSQSCGHDGDVLESAVDAGRALGASHRDRSGGAVHDVHGEHIAHAIDHRDGGFGITRLRLDDGKLVLRVTEKGETAIATRVEVGGVLSNNKGLNVPDVVVPLAALTEKDRSDLAFAVDQNVDWITLSFVQRPEDLAEARRLIGGKAALLAKIEKPAALDRLEGILELCDAVMVARGDLAVEVGNAVVPALQKRMIKLARAHDKVVITATQMMESMITNPVPTRAEVSDVANAVLDGTDAVMLSAETAAGKYPLETVVEMAKICLAAEAAEEYELDADFSGQTFSRIDQSIAMGALFTAHHLNAKGIVALTESGSTALWMSRHRVKIPIYALTTKLSAQRKMALYRNVRPLLMDTSADRDTALAQAEKHLKTRGIVSSGDIYAITCGEPMGAPGGTNMLKISRAE